MRARAAFVLAAAVLSATCAAAEYPARPIRLVVPASPGGAADILSRTIAQKMADAWGQQVVVDNRTGAAGIIGTELGARAAPDGYTIMMGFAGAITVNPSLYRKLPYDVLRDFAPVSLVTYSPLMLTVTNGLTATSVGELLALARAKPGQLNFASTGNGSTQHLTAELFRTMAGIELTHIPYKGSALAYPDLMSGQVSMMFDNMLSLLPFAKGGKVRGLAVTSSRRQPAMPELPTVAEGGVPGYEAVGWYGVLAPAGTPGEVVGRLNREINRILQLPEVRERLVAQGAEVAGGTPAEFSSHIRRELVKWAKVVKDSGARAD